MVRESLVRRARGRGPAPTGAAPARVLEDLERPAPTVDDQRMARHLLGASRTAEGVGRLLQAARALFATGNAHGALESLRHRRGGARGHAPATGRGHAGGGPIAIQRARALLVLGRLDEAERRRASRSAQDPAATPAESCDARIVLATLGILRGRLDWSRDRLREIAADARGGWPPRAARPDAPLARRSRSTTAAISTARSPPPPRPARWRRTVGEWPTWAEATMSLAGTLAELGHLTEAGRVADEALATRHRILHPAAVARAPQPEGGDRAPTRSVRSRGPAVRGVAQSARPDGHPRGGASPPEPRRDPCARGPLRRGVAARGAVPAGVRAPGPPAARDGGPLGAARRRPRPRRRRGLGAAGDAHPRARADGRDLRVRRATRSSASRCRLLRG